MTKNSTILPKKPKSGQSSADLNTNLNANSQFLIQNQQSQNSSNFTSFHNSQSEVPKTTQFASNSVISSNLQKNFQNSSQNSSQNSKIPVPIQNSPQKPRQNPQNEIKPFIRQNQSKLQEKVHTGEIKKNNWTQELKAKINQSAKELEILKSLEQSYNLPSFNEKNKQSKAKITKTENLQEFRQDDYNQNFENREIPEHLQNKVTKTIDQKLDEIHKRGQESWQKNQNSSPNNLLNSSNKIQNSVPNSTTNATNSTTNSNQNLTFGQNAQSIGNTNLQTENQSKNLQIEKNLQRIKEAGEQNRQRKMEVEKLEKINSQNSKLENLINSGQNVIAKPKTNFTEYLERLQNNSQNGQNYDLIPKKSQIDEKTGGQIGGKVGISSDLQTEIKTTSLPKTSPKSEQNIEQKLEQNKTEKNTETLSNSKSLETVKTSNQTGNSSGKTENLGLSFGNKELKSTSLPKEELEKLSKLGEKSDTKIQPKSEEKPQNFLEQLNQIKNNALGKLGIGTISTTSLNLVNTGIIGLNDALAMELNLRGNLQEDFEASKILRLLQALAFSTSKNGQDNLINKLGQFDGQFFELNPAFPFTGKDNLFETFSNILQSRQEFLPLICKKAITQENREKYLKIIQSHLKDKENQRFWTTILLVSYQRGNDAVVFGPLALLSSNYTKLPFVQNLIEKSFGIFDDKEETASGGKYKFISDFESQIRKKYDEIKFKETWANSMSANPGDLGKSGPNFESLITYQFSHRMLKEVVKSSQWSFLDKERSTEILPGTILEAETRFFICGISNNPKAITKVEEEIIRILAIWFAVKFRNFLGKLINEQLLVLKKEKRDKKGENNANLSTAIISNFSKEDKEKIEKIQGENSSQNYSDYDNSAQSEFDRQVEKDSKEAQEYAANEAKTRQKAAQRELEETQIAAKNKTTNSTSNSKIHPAEIAAKKEKERIEKEFREGKISQKQRNSQIQNVEKSLAKQIQSYNSLNPNVALAVGLGVGTGVVNSGTVSIGANAIRDLAWNIVNQDKFGNFSSSNYNPTGNFQNPNNSNNSVQSVSGENLGSFEDSVSYNSASNFVAPQIGKKTQSQQANLTQFGRIGVAQSSTTKNGLPNFGQNPNQGYSNSQKSNQNPNQNSNLSKQGLAVSGVGLTNGAGFGSGQGLGAGVNFGANFGAETQNENLNAQIANLGANSQINGHSIAALLALAQINHKNHPNIDLSSSLRLSLAEILPHLSPEQINNLVKHLLGLFNQKQNVEIIQSAFDILETKFIEQKKNETEAKNGENVQGKNQNEQNNLGQSGQSSNQNEQNSQKQNNNLDQNNSHNNSDSSPNSTNSSQNSNSLQNSSQNGNENQNQTEKSQNSQNPALPNLTIPTNNSPQFSPNATNPSGFVPFSPNAVSPKKNPENKSNSSNSNYNPQQNFKNNSENSENNENLSSSGQTGQNNSQENFINQENLNSQNGNYYQIILEILSEVCNLGRIQNPQNGETGIVPFLTENEYHQNYSKNGKVNKAEYKKDNVQSREAILQKVKAKTGNQNLPNQTYETDFEKAKKSHNDKYLGNLGNIDDKDKSNSQNDNEEKQDSQGAIDPNINPNSQKDKKDEKTDKQKENPEEEKPQTGQIDDNSEAETNNGGNGVYLGDGDGFKQANDEIGKQNVTKENAKRQEKIKNEKNGENIDGENGNEQNPNSTFGQNGKSNNPNSLANKVGDKIKNSELGQKIANSRAGKFAGNALNKLNQARQIMDDPAQFVRDEIAKKLRDAAIKSGLQSLGAFGGSFGATIAGVLIFIFIITMVIVGATAYSYCTKDPLASIFNLTESSYQSIERAFGITPEDEKEKNILEKAAGFVIDRSGVGIVKGIYDAVTGARIRTQSKVGKFIMKLCGISDCHNGSSPADVRSGSSGNNFVGVCLDSQLNGKSDSDTVSLWAGNGGKLRQIPIKVKNIKQVIEAGKKAGVKSETVAFVLSILATESAVENPWNLVGGASNDFYGIAQVGGAERRSWGDNIGGYKGDKYYLENPYYQMKIVEAGLKEKTGAYDSVSDSALRGECNRIGTPLRPRPQGKSEIYKAGYSWLSLCGVDGFETTSIAYAEAAEKNFAIANCTGGNDIPKAVQNNPTFPNPLQFFGPIEASAADKYRWINPVPTNETRFNTSSGKFTSYDTGSGGVDVRLGFPGKPYEESKLVPLVAHLSGEVVYTKDRGSATTVEGSYGTEIGIYYPDLKTAEFPNGVTVYYAHLNDLQNNPATNKQWQSGDKISPGQRFGTQGASGSLRPFGDNYLIDVTIKPGKDGASRGGAINGLNDVYNKLWLGMLTYYDANTDKIIANNFSPTTGVASGSGSDSPVGGSGSDKLFDPCDCLNGGKSRSGTTTVATGNIGSAKITTTDQWTAIITAILEASSVQGRLDVIKVLANRVGNNWGGLGKTVVDQAHASGQFVAINGISKGSLKDREAAVNALVNSGKGYTRESANKTLDETIAALQNPVAVKDSEDKIKNFTSFKGTSEYYTMKPGDFLRNDGENFYHPDGSSGAAFPISSLFGNKALSFLPHSTEFFAKAWGGVEVNASESEQDLRNRVAGYFEKGEMYQVKHRNGTDTITGIKGGVDGAFKRNPLEFIADLRKKGIVVVLGPADWGRTGGDHAISNAVDIWGAGYLKDIQSGGPIKGFKTSGIENAYFYAPDTPKVGGNIIDPRIYRHDDVGADPKAMEIFVKIYDIAFASGAGSQFIGNPDFIKNLRSLKKTKTGPDGYSIQDDAEIYGSYTGAHDTHFHVAFWPSDRTQYKYSEGTAVADTTGSIPKTVTGNNCNTFCVDTNNQLRRVKDGVVGEVAGSTSPVAGNDPKSTEPKPTSTTETGKEPKNYAEITQAHRDFIAKLAQESGYSLQTSDGGGILPDAQKAFNEMATAAKKDGLNLEIASGYRSREYQVGVFFSKIDIVFNGDPNDPKVISAYMERMRLSAPPGYSEHQTGKGMDIVSQDPRTQDLDPQKWIGTPSEKWLADNSGKYGFRITYKKDRLNSTKGTTYEPWHLFYTGNKGSNFINQIEKLAKNQNNNIQNNTLIFANNSQNENWNWENILKIKNFGQIEVNAATKSEVVEYKGKDGVTVRGTLYTPDGFDATKYKENIVILGHDGFNGDSSGNNYYTKNLRTGQRIADQGSPVFVMEYESGAASRGGPQVFSHDVDDTIQAMNMLQERLKIKNNFTLAGSSRGAGVSALAANRDARVSKLAVAYPVAELSNWTTNNQVYSEAKKQTGGDLTKLNLANNPPSNKSAEILITYGDNDTILKEGNAGAIQSVGAYAASLKAKGYNVQTEIVKGGDHGYITVNSGLSGAEQKAQENFLAFAGGKGNVATVLSDRANKEYRKCSEFSGSTTGGSGGTANTTPGANGMVAPTSNADPNYAKIMDKLSTVYNNKCGVIANSTDIIGKPGATWPTAVDRGDGTGCCYAMVWAGLLINKIDKPDSPWAKVTDQLDSVLASAGGNLAIDFDRAMRLPSLNGKPNYEAIGLRDLKTEGITDPNDPRVPAGAIIVVTPNDINVKMADGRFVNYSDMSSWMKNLSSSNLLGIYVPK